VVVEVVVVEAEVEAVEVELVVVEPVVVVEATPAHAEATSIAAAMNKCFLLATIPVLLALIWRSRAL
jgi:hypothetical protein